MHTLRGIVSAYVERETLSEGSALFWLGRF